MTSLIRELLADESGATAIEYGLIAALVSVAAIGALTALGGSLRGIFGAASASVDAAVKTAAETSGGLPSGGEQDTGSGGGFYGLGPDGNIIHID